MAKKEQISIPKVKSPDGGDKELFPVTPGQEGMKTATESSEIFQLMESRDEEQMLQEIMGVFSQEYVYDIPFKGGSISQCSTPGCQLAKQKTPHTHVRGLSWSGIKEARRIFKGIDTREVSKPTLIDHDSRQYYECKVTAVDLRTGNVTTTYKRHPLMKKRRDGSLMEDEFAFEIIQSKAKRNAISELLPQPLVRAWIGDWVSGKKDFDPKRAVELKEGESFTVEKESRAQSSFRDKTKEEPRLPKPVLDKLNSVLKEFEAKGGLKILESTKQYCRHFKVDNIAYISVDQANKVMKAVTARIDKLQSEAPKTDDTRTKAQNIQAIKDKLTELGWDLKDTKLAASLLKPYGLDALEDLDRADDILVQEILDKVTGAN